MGASKMYRQYQHRSRDLYAEHPHIGRFLLLAQHAVARLEQGIRGKERMLRDEAKFRASHDCNYKYNESCKRCSLKGICDGFHGDYVEFFGTDEAEPITDISPVDDHLFYIQRQEKIVEEADKAWAL